MGAADTRRQELVRRQTSGSSISPQDVERFKGTLNRFDAILSNRSGGGKAQENLKLQLKV
jgi:hypothetical protein